MNSALPLAVTPLAVTLGDPAGVGPQIAWEAWRRRGEGDRPFYVLAPPYMLTAFAGETRAVLIRTPAEAAEAFADGLPIFPLAVPGDAPTPGTPDPASVPAIIGSIAKAVGHVRSGEAAAVITNPISKALLNAAGFPHPGHTEYLADLAADDGPAPHPVMMLVGGGLRVALVTIHTPLADVPRRLSQDLIGRVARIVHTALLRDFGLPQPRIGLCGLNPHAGEGGMLGAEETAIINPAARTLRAEGVDISDARPADTIFHEAREGGFDAVIAMYHDQGLIPVKTLDIWGGVNVTLGLPFIRTSPDHGTAYDAAAARSARPDSLIAALRLADQMATARAASP
jgi:4-hydroxythreonine-4-phosphate dehydrogenase